MEYFKMEVVRALVHTDKTSKRWLDNLALTAKLAGEVYRIMDENGLTLPEMAELCEMDPNVFRRTFPADRKVQYGASLSKVVCICRNLGISMDELFLK